MPTYTFTLYDPATRTTIQQKKSGQENVLRQAMEKRGYSILSIQEVASTGSFVERQENSRRLRMSELVIFCRSMAIMVKSGNSLSEALDFYAKGAKGPMVPRYQAISKRLAGGEGVYPSFYKSGLFDDVFCGVLSAGEKGGSLAVALKMLGDRYNNLSLFVSKTRRAVSIPVGITVFMGGLFIASQFFVVPMVEKMLRDSHVVPDPFSAVIFQIAAAVRSSWPLWTMALGGFFGALVFSPPFRSGLIYLAMSKIKSLYQVVMGMRQTTLLSTLRVLYGNGVDLLESMGVAATALTKTPMEAEIRRAAQAYKSGVPLAEALKRNTSCDEKLIHMVRVAEDKDLVSQFENIEEMYIAETNDAMERLSQQVNIAAYFLATAIIGLVFIGSYVPIILMAARMMTSH